MELKSEKAFRIADLILRYQEETISEEEMEELRLWLKKSTEHQQQFENLNDRDYIRRKRELDLSINPAAAYTAFSERIARERPWSYRKLRGLAAVAAVCLIAIGIYWCWLREDRNGTLEFLMYRHLSFLLVVVRLSLPWPTGNRFICAEILPLL